MADTISLKDLNRRLNVLHIIFQTPKVTDSNGNIEEPIKRLMFQ